MVSQRQTKLNAYFIIAGHDEFGKPPWSCNIAAFTNVHKVGVLPNPEGFQALKGKNNDNNQHRLKSRTYNLLSIHIKLLYSRCSSYAKPNELCFRVYKNIQATPIFRAFDAHATMHMHAVLSTRRGWNRAGWHMHGDPECNPHMNGGLPVLFLIFMRLMKQLCPLRGWEKALIPLATTEHGMTSVPKFTIYW